MKKFIFFFILSAISLKSFAGQSETFIIEFGGRTVKVISAASVSNEYNVIIKNRALLPLKGKIISRPKKTDIDVAVPVDQDRPFKVEWSATHKFFFVPFSPPYEEIILSVGKGRYEIPPKD